VSGGRQPAEPAERAGRVRAAVLGLDIGGSTTRAVRAEDGRCIAETRAGSANIRSVGAEEAGRQLDAVLAGLRTDDVAAVCAGAAGADSAPARAALRELLAKRLPGAAVEVVHDARLILAAADLDAGIAVIAGTGSAGWGVTPDGREARAGGFGYLLGDEGSGYWTTREAVRHVLHRADTGAAPDALGTALLAACDVATPVDLFDLFYARPERAFWARQAGVVVRLAESDQVAAAILGTAAEALARLASTVGARLGSTGPVVLGGGFAVHEPALRAGVADRLATVGITDVRVIPRDPVAGAVRLAHRLVETS
jgi:N-acetylglucosamine kinase-like BadF-type ATPase